MDEKFNDHLPCKLALAVPIKCPQNDHRLGPFYSVGRAREKNPRRHDSIGI